MHPGRRLRAYRSTRETVARSPILWPWCLGLAGAPRYGGCMGLLTDPWEGVPADRRLDFKVVREPLESLTAAVVINVERSLPPAITAVPGALPLLLLLTKVAETTFSTIRYFCAEDPEDPARRISFASSAPPLVRSLLDEIYTVVFIGEDVAGRGRGDYKKGWRGTPKAEHPDPLPHHR